MAEQRRLGLLLLLLATAGGAYGYGPLGDGSESGALPQPVVEVSKEGASLQNRVDEGLAVAGRADSAADRNPVTDPPKGANVSIDKNDSTQGSGNGEAAGWTLDDQVAVVQRAYGIQVILHPAVRRAEPVANGISQLSPEEAVRLLFRGYDFFLQYGAEGVEGANRLKRVWVFPRNEGDRQQIVAEELLQAARPPVSGDPAVELRNAMDRSSQEAQIVFARALNDQDENIRYKALDAALQEGLPVVPSLLEGAFLHDQSEVVRAAAFDALIIHSESESIDVAAMINLALEDPSPLVQSHALALQEAHDAPIASPGSELEPISE